MSERSSLFFDFATWAKADERYWRSYCANSGECFYCGRSEGHEEGCRNEPQQEEEDE
jgi:hypothetical protein